MPTFQGNPFSNFYKRILQISQSSNTGVDTTTRNVETGDGSITALQLSDDQLKIQPRNDNTINTLDVTNTSGASKFKVDTISNQVTATGHVVNTQYAYFGVTTVMTSQFAANKHYAIPFNHNEFSNTMYLPILGTDTDPDTTFTTADANSTRASDLVPVMWRVPDDITIDEIKHFEGADDATGDTTRMHLMSYTFTSGSTSALTSGAVVANTTSDLPNAGNEQAYLQDWRIDTANIDAGTVLVCTFRSDSNNADYAINVTIKYHLR